MLSNAANVLCILLTLQSFSNIAKSHPVAAESGDNVGIHEFKTTRSPKAGVMKDPASLKNTRDVIWQMPRGIPIIKPVPHDDPNTDPSSPDTNNPDPSQPGSPHDPSKPNDSPQTENPDPSKPRDPTVNPDGFPTTCRRSTSGTLLHRCTTENDPIEDDAMGEGDTDAVSDQSPPPGSPPRDLFTVLRNGGTLQNGADALYQTRVGGAGSDAEIPDIDTINQIYQIAATNSTDVTGDTDPFNLIAQVAPILEAASGYFARDGKHFEVKSPTAGLGFLRNTYTSDGNVMFAEYADKAEDLTPNDQRQPWFKMSMYLYNKQMNLDPSQLTTVVICKCTNKDTIATNDAAIRQLQPNEQGYYVLHKDAPQGSAELDAYNAWLATPNGMGPLWMVGSFYDQMGSEITEIWTQASEPGTSVVPQSIPGTVIKLGPRS